MLTYIRKIIKILKIIWELDHIKETLITTASLSADNSIAVKYLRDDVKNLGLEFAVDVHHNSPDIIIAIDQLRGRDYVKVFNMPNNTTFCDTVEHLKYLERDFGRVGRIDAYPPSIVEDIRGSIYARK